MINMMADILQYVPYALLAGFVMALILTGVYVTISFFRNQGKNPAAYKPLKLAEKYPRFFGTPLR